MAILKNGSLMSLKLANIIKQQMIPEQNEAKKGTRKPKKDLLRLEKPIYQLKRNEEGKPESIIAKLMMQKKEKPQIGFLPRSQLFDQLNKFIPILKQSNQELLKQEIKPEMQFDAKLEEVEDSSSSSDQDEDEMAEESQKMEEEESEKPAVLESVDEFQFNILKYPYMPKEQPSVETKPDEKQSPQAIVAEALANKFERIVEIKEGKGNHLQELE